MTNPIFLQLQRINNLIIVGAFLSIIGVLLSSTVVDYRWFPTIAIVSLVLLADFVVFSYFRTKNIFSFRIIFLVLTFLFHMGYSWIFLFNPSYSFEGMDFEEMFNASIVFESYLYSLAASIAIFLGMQLGDRRWSNHSRKFTKTFTDITSKLLIARKFTEKSYRNLGIAILAVSLPIRLYIDISKISLGGSGDYLSTFDLEVNGYVSMLADLSIVGIVLLLIYFRKRLLASSIVLGTSILYYVVSMGSGSRGAAMISIIILLFAYTVCVRKFRTITIIAISILGILLATYITGLGISRIDSATQLDEKYGTQSRFLQEFGGTQLTTILTMRMVSGEGGTGFSYGETYLASLLTIFPNVTSEYEAYVDENNFQKVLNYPTIGGSYIAELYYNFGFVAIIVAILVGFLLSRFEGGMSRLALSERFVLLAFSIFIARQSLWWIRDSALVFPRHVVVGFIVLMLICMLLYKFGFINYKNKRISNE